ncbi:hypothetical protein MNBD_GAMMA11-2517 [hydrothermal vent metagenome]|uniref:SPOR domain-containing protein n=1 Tax=hydrothermal vent metagenome TaxID=652676 RepID=A0A3B0XNG5_9ZZZZ
MCCRVIYIQWLLFLLAFFSGITHVYAKEEIKYIDLAAPYVIVVASASERFSVEDLNGAYTSNGHRYYVVKVKSKGKTLYQLRYGFFRTPRAAKKIQAQLKLRFKKTYVSKTKQAERNISSQTELVPSAHAKLAEYLIVSTAYETANVIAEIAGKAIKKASVPEARTEVEAVDEDTDDEPVKVAEIKYDNYLVLNLKTTNNLSDFDKIIKHPEIKNNAFYISELKIDGRIWYQYRLGFFVDEKIARQKLAALRSEFPLARMIRVTSDEKEDATARVRSFFAVAPVAKNAKPLPKLKAVAVDKLQALMKKGSNALSDKRYAAAIRTFTQLLRYPESKYSMDSQEFLGFAYELNGNIAESRREYDRYLSLYPESRGANRVRQRLASLLTAREDPRKKLRERRARTRDSQWQNFGSFSQFYRRDVSQLNDQSTREDLSLLSSDVSVSSRYRGEEYLMSSRFIGGHDLDFTGVENKSSSSISSLYFDVTNLDGDFYGIIGRQSVSKDGILGRMDGAIVSYKLNDYVKLNASMGFVVEDTRKSANKDKFFTGISADLGTFSNAWDFNVYYIQQKDGSLMGRQAIGSEVRYFHPRRTLFALVDYDVMFKELNTVLAIGNWQFENRIQVNATIDIRRSPFLTTSNALLNNSIPGVTTTDDLLTPAGGGLTESQVRARAINQTATSQTFTLGFNAPISDKYQISADVTSTKLSDSLNETPVQPAPPEPPVAVPGTVAGAGPDYFYNLQLIGNSVFMMNDSMIAGFRFSDTDRGKVNSLNFNLRFPVSRNWRLNPRLRIDERTNTDGTDQSVIAYALRVDYRLKRNINFEFDLGQEQTDTGRLNANSDERRALFLSLGYRYDF